MTTAEIVQAEKDCIDSIIEWFADKDIGWEESRRLQGGDILYQFKGGYGNTGVLISEIGGRVSLSVNDIEISLTKEQATLLYSHTVSRVDRLARLKRVGEAKDILFNTKRGLVLPE